MTQQKEYDVGTFQSILLAFRNKLTGDAVKVGFTISAEGSNYDYKTEKFGRWNLCKHLERLQGQQGGNMKVKLKLAPDKWDEKDWGGNDPSSWGEEIGKISKKDYKGKVPEEMYHPATITINMQDNKPTEVNISPSPPNLAFLNPNSKSRPSEISENVWRQALKDIKPSILVLLQPIWIMANTANFSDRPKKFQSPTLIVLHQTGGSTIGSAINTFINEKAKVSAHYVIDIDGQVVKMVMNSKCAWHADPANDYSIGIEIVHNDGERVVKKGSKNVKDPGYNPFTEEQYRALIDLIQKLQARYNIPVYKVIGHSDVQLAHNCPGPNFDWKRLEDRGLGLKVDQPEKINLNSNDFPIKQGSSSELIEELKEDLRKIGYNISQEEKGYGEETAVAVQKFKRHFLAGSRRPKDETWNNVTMGNSISLEVARMIKAVRGYVDAQQPQQSPQ